MIRDAFETFRAFVRDHGEAFSMCLLSAAILLMAIIVTDVFGEFGYWLICVQFVIVFVQIVTVVLMIADDNDSLK